MAKISNSSLLLVQTGNRSNSIQALELKDYVAPIAVQPVRELNKQGVPGVMFPSEQFLYNPGTGELSLRGDNANVKELIGYIGYEENLPPGFDLNNLPLTVTPSMDGHELPGQYYVVIDIEYEYLTNDWGTGYYDPFNPDPSNIKRVYIGDEVFKDTNGDWKVRSNEVNKQYLYKNFTIYPHIDDIVTTSGPATT